MSAETATPVEVRVGRCETRYRLPPSARAEQQRLDQVRTRVLERAFARGLARAGLPAESEVCIRHLRAPVSLRLSQTDEALVAGWGEAVADAIAAAIRDGSSASTGRVVIYHSRRQALLDLALGVGRGDLRRSWAWRQLGLWRPGRAAGEGHAVSELVHSLCNEPAMVAPTLSALAESGWLPRVAVRIAESQWRALAAAGLSDAGADALPNETGGRPSSRAASEARRVIGSSPLVRALASSGWLAGASDVVRRSVAILAVLDVEPTLLATGRASVTVSLIASGLAQPPGGPAADFAQSAGAQPAGPETAGPESGGTNRGTRGAASERTGQNQPDCFDRREDAGPDEIAAAALEARDEPWPRRAEADAGAPRRVDKSDEGAGPADLRQRAFTRLGGLLFLLHVVEDLDLPEQILAHPVLGERRFAWVLHQLALALPALDVAPSDPAALAFAGLSPRAAPPTELDGPATAAEAEALGEMAGSIIGRLHSLLDYADVPPAGLPDVVCRRRAEVVADPGWIEVRLSLDEVSVEIRRAGLDLDPGYVRWLGVVVRFVYE